MSTRWRWLWVAGILSVCLGPGPAMGGSKPAGGWIPLFNGKDLTGWTPKIRGQALGQDPARTFRVEGGLLKVVYDRETPFEGRFGHLVHSRKLSHYRLRIEYRFVGEQAPGGPAWALRNSGVMIHGQAPETMERDQDFPVSIEVQFLGGSGQGERPTANVCTPGTNIVMEGKLVTKHCLSSRSRTYHGEGWVTVEVEVRGGKLIRHLIGGQPVLEYSDPQLDDRDPQARKLLASGIPLHVTAGYVYLQAESHPVEFRKVELLPLR